MARLVGKLAGLVAVAAGIAVSAGATQPGASRQIGAAGPPRAATFNRAVTFNKDVALIIFQNCTSCHRPGELAPFSLQTYDDARQRARAIAGATERRFMPPWKPEPGFGEFEGSRRLSDRQIQTLRQWVDDGALEGDPNDLPPAPVFTPGWQLGPPDLILTMPEAFAMPATGPDLFRNFVLPVPITAERHVRAIEFRPGNSRAIHHVRILIDETRECRWRDAQDPEPGFAGMDAPGAHFPDGHFLGWAAGKIPSATSLPWPLEAGSDLVVEMHLRPTGRIESVQASIGLYFSDSPPAAAPVMLRMGSRTLDIPAGEADHVVTDSYVLPVDVEALSIYPHAHYLGRDMTIVALRPDGRTERLLHIANWDFNWQDDYKYARGVALPRGATIVMRYVYDNSTRNPRNPHVPPERVRYGPQASDEMCELLVQLVPKRQADLGVLRADVARKTLLADIAGEEKRIADAPDDYETRNALGVHYFQSGRVNDALSQFEASLRLAPDHAVAHFNLAMLDLGRQRFDEAYSHFERAIAARPDYPEAHSNLGVLLQRMGRLDEAMDHFRSALAAMPDNAAAHNNLGRVLMRVGRFDEAVAELKEPVRIQPGNPMALDALAAGYAAAGRFDLAVETAQQALARAVSTGNDALAREIRERLQGYQRRGPP
jgi:tetratricopeptide (TPR) repeat protein/mono/diheme cytochrome c family protein